VCVNILDLSASGEDQISDSCWEVMYLYSVKETRGIAARIAKMLPMHREPIAATFGALRIAEAETRPAGQQMAKSERGNSSQELSKMPLNT